VKIYALEAKLDGVAASNGKLTLFVSPTRAYPGFDTRRMVYVQQPHELGYFSRNEWADSPSRMFAPLLVQSLEHRGIFHAVVLSQNAAQADVRLDTEIVRLQQEFLSKPSKLHLTMRAQLIDSSTRQVLATQEFDVSEEAPSDDPYGGVIAANRAVNTVLARIADFCSVQMANQPLHAGN